MHEPQESDFRARILPWRYRTLSNNHSAPPVEVSHTATTIVPLGGHLMPETSIARLDLALRRPRSLTHAHRELLSGFGRAAKLVHISDIDGSTLSRHRLLEGFYGRGADVVGG